MNVGLMASVPSVAERLRQESGGLGFQFELFAWLDDLTDDRVAQIGALVLCVGSNRPDKSIVAAVRERFPSLPVLLLRDGPVSRSRVTVGSDRFPFESTQNLDSLFRHLTQIRCGSSGPRRAALVGGSDAMKELRRQIELVSTADIAVALHGETGTGKELVARSIHEASSRAREPFVAINCAAIPESLQESQLFGYERGAFTGAITSTRGAFEQANHGTLFLDEVGDTSLATQVTLLRVLQEKSVRRLGGFNEIPVDVRIVSATSRDLESDVVATRFRGDLYYRVVVYPIRLPPLRDRLDDLPVLVEHFREKHGRALNSKVQRFHPRALEALARHDWPGNVRELENVVSRCILVCRGDEVAVSDLPEPLRGERRAASSTTLRSVPGVPAPDSAAPRPEEVLPLREVERRAIDHALAATRGNVGHAARLLGIGRATLYRRLAELAAPAEVETTESTALPTATSA
jgi:DNA-binding NtrC family response regulator